MGFAFGSRESEGDTNHTRNGRFYILLAAAWARLKCVHRVQRLQSDSLRENNPTSDEAPAA